MVRAASLQVDATVLLNGCDSTETPQQTERCSGRTDSSDMGREVIGVLGQPSPRTKRYCMHQKTPAMAAKSDAVAKLARDQVRSRLRGTWLMAATTARGRDPAWAIYVTAALFGPARHEFTVRAPLASGVPASVWRRTLPALGLNFQVTTGNR